MKKNRIKLIATFFVALMMLSSIAMFVGDDVSDADEPATPLYYAMGWNNYGQIGNGTTADATSPTQIVASLGTLSKIVTADNTTSVYFLTSTGALYGVGNNAQGQLGTGNTDNQSSPVRIGSSLGTIVDVKTAYRSTYFLTSDGKLYGVGYNNFGQMGNNSTTSAKTPTQIGSSLGTITDFWCSSGTTFFTTSDGKLYGMGYNSSGQIGNGTTTNVKTPTQIGSSLGTITKVACTNVRTMILTSDGKLYGMGNNSSNVISSSGDTSFSTPTRIGSSLGTITDVAMSGSSMIFKTSDGKLYGVGSSSNGMLGASADITTPTQIGSSLGTVSKFGMGSNMSVILTSDGKLYGSGKNDVGQLGLGNRTAQYSYTQIASAVGTVSDFTCVGSTTFVITSDGKLYGMGKNDYGQIGDGTTTNVTTPTQIGSSLGTVTSIVGSGYTTYFTTTTPPATYTVSIASNNTSYGTVSSGSIANVPSGSAITVSGATITVNGTTVTATPETDTAQYDYAFSGWSVQSGATVTDDMTITATFTRTLQTYTVSIASNNTSYGTVNNSSIASVPYGTSITVSGSTVTVNGTTATATPTTDTAQYDYAFSGWSVQSGATVTDDMTIIATFTRTLQTYTVSIASNNTDYGTVSRSTIAAVPYGTTILVSGASITINATTTTATPATATAQYDYAFSGWSVSTGDTVTGDLSITATFTRSAPTYTVSIASNNTDYGTVSPTTIANVPYGSAITVSGATITVNGITATATPTTDTAQYDYAFSGWSVSTGDTVTGNLSVTATFTRTLQTYTVSIVSNNTSYGTVDNSSVASVPYGTSITVSGATITVNGTTVTATPKTATAQYTFAFGSWSVSSGATVTGNTSITATFTADVRFYTVSLASNNTDYGTVSRSTIASVSYGSTFAVSGNSLTINGLTATATPKTATAQYTFAFGSWSVQSGATVTGDTTVTATFTATVNNYTVSIASSNTAYGTVNKSSIANVPYGTSITVSGATITVNGTTVTATPKTDTAQYDYAFSGWSVSTGDTVTGNLSVTATFTRTLQTYTVSIASNNTAYGTVNKSSITAVPYGTTVIVSGASITINATTATATPTTDTAQYDYSFTGWSVSTGATVTADMSVTATFTRTLQTYTVSIASNNTAYGTVDKSTVASVPYGSAITVSGTTIAVNGTTVTATPNTDTAQYTYAFSGWSIQNGTTVTANMSVTATFTATVNNYTVSIASNNTSYGTVNKSSIANVPYGTSIAVNGATITVSGTTVTATPSPDTAQYDYAFSGWSIQNGTTVTGNLSVTATFTATVKTYTVSIASNNTAYGTVNKSNIASVPYGSAITVNGSTITVNGITATATPTTDTAQYDYAFSGWSVNTGATVTADMSVTATFTRTLQTYTVSIASNNTSYGTVDKSTVASVPYGTSITVNGTSITVNGTTATATPTTDTAQYDYAFSGWSIQNGTTVTGNLSVTATFAATVKTYTVSIASNNTSYGTVNKSSIASVPYGSAITVSGNTMTVNGTTVTATPTANTPQYGYAFSSWSIQNGTTVTGDTSITATFTRSESVYTVSIASNNTAYGTVSPTAIANVPYGSAITVSGATITVNGTTVTATPETDTAQYDYEFVSWSVSSGATVTADTSITATFTRTVNTFTVSIASNNTSYGTVNKSNIASVPYGSAITVSGNTMTVNGTTVTATPTANTPQYGYALSSWSVQSGATVTADTSITATFTRSESVYTVTVASNNTSYGTVSPTSITNVLYGSAITVSGATITVSGTTATATPTTDTAQYDYEFVSWSVSSGATVTGNITVTATFTATVREYTISWDIDGTVTTSTLAYGQTPTHEDPTKLGHTFTGWSPSIVPVTGNATYTATFSLNTFTVTFNANGGTVIPAYKTGSIDDPVTLVTPTKSNYAFSGWFTQATGGDSVSFPYVPTQDITLYAHWTPITYTVSFTGNGGTPSVLSATGSVESAVTLPTATAADKIFTGWYTQQTAGELIGLAGALYYPTNDINLYAHWTDRTIVTFVLNYDVNGGFGGPPSVSHTSDESQTYTTTIATGDPIRYGYTFKGWATTSTATAAEYTSGDSITLEGNTVTTLYAVWHEGEEHSIYKSITDMLPILIAMGILISMATILLTRRKGEEPE